MSSQISHAPLRQALAVLAIIAFLIPSFPYIFRLSLAFCAIVGFRALFRKEHDLGWVLALSPVGRALGKARLWPLTGFALLLVMLTALEVQRPYYFTQDDSHSQFLPVLLLAMKQFFSSGTLPVWNAYQDFGMPLIGGGYALTYPPLYLSYALAWLMGDETAMFEVLGWLHFAAGYWLMWASLRRLGVRPSLSASFSLAYVLAGVNLVLGASWVSVLMLPAFYAALLLSVVTLLRNPRPGLRWAVWSGAVGGVFFHVGHAQFWVYGMALWGVGVAWLIACAPKRDLLPAAIAACVAGLLALAIAMPLLWLQYQLQLNIPADGGSGDVWKALNNLMVPATLLSKAQSVLVRCSMMFAGGLPLLCAMAFLMLSISAFGRHAFTRLEAGAMVILALAFIAFLWMLGDKGPVWRALENVGPFNKFNSSFKLMTLFALFSVAAGAQFAEALARRAPRWAALARWAAVAVMGLSLWGAWIAKPLYTYADTPYPPLVEPLRSLQQTGEGGAVNAACRAWYIGSDRSPMPGFTPSLVNNYASVYEIFSANRYDQRVTRTRASAVAQRVSRDNINLFLHEYGICRVIVQNPAKAAPSVTPSYRGNGFEKGLENYSVYVGQITPYLDYTLYDVAAPETKPLVYFADAPARPVAFTVLGNGLSIAADAAERERVLVANFHFRPWFRAFADGAELKMRNDQLQRMVVFVPPGVGEIRLRYSPPWWQGLARGALLLLGAGLLGGLYVRLTRGRWPGIQRFIRR